MTHHPHPGARGQGLAMVSTAGEAPRGRPAGPGFDSPQVHDKHHTETMKGAHAVTSILPAVADALTGQGIRHKPTYLWAPALTVASGARVAEIVDTGTGRVDVYLYEQDTPGGLLGGLAHRRMATPAAVARRVGGWLS